MMIWGIHKRSKSQVVNVIYEFLLQTKLASNQFPILARRHKVGNKIFNCSNHLGKKLRNMLS